MVKKESSKPTPVSKAPKVETQPTSVEPTPDEITALVRVSLGGISRTMARRILIARALGA